MKNIISQQWLLDHIEDEDLIILDARAGLSDPNYGLEVYKEGHIEGARFVSMEETMTSEKNTHGGRHPLPEMDKFLEEMKELGIDNDTKIVVYDDGNLEMAGRLWWLLRYSGREKVYVLAGGMKSWLLNNYKVTAQLPEIHPAKSLALNINQNIKVDMKVVRAAIGSERIAMVDSRSYERYTGAVEPIDTTPGHIPSALNYPWTDLIDGGDIMSQEDLKSHYEDLQGYEELFVYCGSGITGAVNYLFMEEVGLKPKLYAGSYSDWISYPDNHVVNSQLEDLTALEIWEKLYSKELNCKKNILEYIEITKILKKDFLGTEKITETYNYIYQSIDKLKNMMKPNTIMHLKNNLKAQLGKYVIKKDPKAINYFIELFKEAYPKDKRRKDFTWVLMDLNNITKEQLWITLTYINKEVIANDFRLSKEHKRDIIEVIGIVIKKSDIKFINNIRSLSPLTEILKIRIEKSGKHYLVEEKPNMNIK